MEDKSGAGMVRVATLNLWGRGGERDERRRVLAEDSVCWAVVAEVFARA